MSYRYLFLLLVCFTVSCTSMSEPISTQTATVVSTTPTLSASTPVVLLPTALYDQTSSIKAAQNIWNRQQIAHYRVDIHYFTFRTEIFAHLIVTNGQIIEQSCQAGKMFDERDTSQCERFAAEPERYMVDRLFITAQQLNDEFILQESTQTANSTPTFRFDNHLGYPLQLIWQLPEYTEWNIKLTILE